jgi:hypothetical protein
MFLHWHDTQHDDTQDNYFQHNDTQQNDQGQGILKGNITVQLTSCLTGLESAV